MKIQELKKKLNDLDIPKNSYCLTGFSPHNTYCLEKVFMGWQVYFSERGDKNNIREFPTEEEACLYLFEELKKVFK